MASIDCERCGAHHEPAADAADEGRLDAPPALCRECGAELHPLRAEAEAEADPETTRRPPEASASEPLSSEETPLVAAAEASTAEAPTAEASTAEASTTEASTTDATETQALADTDEAPALATTEASPALASTDASTDATPIAASTDETPAPAETAEADASETASQTAQADVPAPAPDDAPAPESVIPLDSRDFVRVHGAERRAPRPPLKPRAETAADESDGVLADPFARSNEPSAPPPPLSEPERARTDAPLARSTRPSAPRSAPSRRVTGALLLALGGALAVNLFFEKQEEARSREAVVAPPAVLPAKAASLASPETVPVAAPLTRPAELSAPEDATIAPVAPVAPSPGTPEARAADTQAIAGRTDAAPRRNAGAPGLGSPAKAVADLAFDKKALELALGSAAEQAKGCRKSSDPAGVAVVTITFAPSGRATSANVSGPPFAGTETGGCIASMMRSTRVPPYSGDFVTVKKTIVVQ